MDFVSFDLNLSKDIIICQSNTIYELNGKKFVQFDSLNFPQSLVNNAVNYLKECKGKFTVTFLNIIFF